MPINTWIASPESLKQDEALVNQVTAVLHNIYEADFADELMVNHKLPVEVRAIRDIDGWRVFLLLTPWMLSRIYLRFDATDIAIPESWSAGSRTAEPHLVLGPSMTLTLLAQKQKVNLNYHPELGHYLVQPLMMRMEQFQSAKEVHAAWNEVIETRNENMRKRQLECHWQQDVSRREFFTRLAQR